MGTPMSVSQFDHPRLAPRHRAVTTSGRWIDDTKAGDYRLAPLAPTDPGRGQATALLDAATRMHDSSDPQTLLRVIASEALRLLLADGVVILAEDKQRRAPVLHLLKSGAEADPAAITMLCLRLGVDRLLEPGQVTDLDHRPHHPARSDGADQADPARWRSLLVVDLSSPRSTGATQLVWYSREPNAFTTTGDLAVSFAGHAALAARTINERHHLERAADSRTITGQATGILMNRYQLSAGRAFEILRRCSQDRNIRLWDVAEAIIRTGEIPA